MSSSEEDEGGEGTADLLTFLRAAFASHGVPSDLARSRVLRPGQAAAYLGLSRKMLWWLRRHRAGPAYYLLGDTHAVGYKVSDLDEWLALRRVAIVSKTA